MDWLITGFIGWCGTGWPIRFWGGGGGGGLDDYWPPHCWVCGGLVGFVSAILVARIAGVPADAGFIGSAIVAFAAGSVGNTIVGGAVRLMRGSTNKG